MKRLILFSLVVLLIAASADDDIVLEDFGLLDISPTMGNGTVSELTPYMASLRMLREDMNNQFGYGHFCGGVFISRKHVLTLASCLQRKNEIVYSYDLEVVAGTRYRYDSSDAKILSVGQIIIHPGYVFETDIPDNIAIVQLKEEVSSDDATIAPIMIAGKKAAFGDYFQIFGWGTPQTNSSNRELQTGRINVTVRSVCAHTFDNRFCAGPNFIGGCYGDDGGAAAFDGQLYGLIDYRPSQYCNETRAAHLYVDVFEYRDWIASIIGDTLSLSTTTPSGSVTHRLSALLVTIIVMISLNKKHFF